MRWFKDLKVSRKLLLGFLVVSIITMIVGLFSYSKTSRLNELGTSVTKKQAPNILYLGNMGTFFNSVAVCERGLLIKGFTQRNIREAQYKAYDVKLASFKKNFDLYKASPRGELEEAKWKELSAAYEEWMGLAQNFMQASKEMDALLAQGVTLKDAKMDAVEEKMLTTYLAERTPFVKLADVLNALIDFNWKLTSEASDQMEQVQQTTALWIVIITLAGFAIAINIGIYISRLISKPLEEATNVMSELSQGNLRLRMTFESKDELGILAKSMNVFSDTLKGFVKSMYDTAEGDLSYKRVIKTEKNEMAPALEKIVDTLKDLTHETDVMIEKYVNGETNYKGNEEKFKGGYRTIIEGFNKSVNAIITVVRDGTEVMRKLSDGDLTARMHGDHKNNFKGYQDDINHLGESLEKLVTEISEAVSATASASTQISSSAEEMAAGAQEQSAQAAEVASAVEEMASTILETNKNADNASHAAKNAGTIAKEGGRVVDETVRGMIRIADVVKKSAETVQELGKNSDQIGEIVQVINDIADQTNLLALNAAIEAARAGEQGRGFAVVADEVRKLAERTTKATKEIASMIKQIQKDTSGAVDSIQQGTIEVEKGKQLADKAGESLKEIINGAEQVVNIVTQVAAASQEQASAAEQISKNIEAISSVTHESATGVQQIAKASEDLNRLTEHLQNLTSQFKIHEGSGRAFGNETHKRLTGGNKNLSLRA